MSFSYLVDIYWIFSLYNLYDNGRHQENHKMEFTLMLKKQGCEVRCLEKCPRGNYFYFFFPFILHIWMILLFPFPYWMILLFPFPYWLDLLNEILETGLGGMSRLWSYFFRFLIGWSYCLWMLYKFIVKRIIMSPVISCVFHKLSSMTWF